MAVLIVSPDEGVAAVRAVPLSRVSGELKEQGMLDSMLLNVERRLQDESKTGADLLQELHGTLERSILVTVPQPVAITTTVVDAMNALYRAYVAPRSSGGGGSLTKGALLDRVVSTLRERGMEVGRGTYLGGFLFDAVIVSTKGQTALEVLSFALARKDWTPVLHDAGHFLFALDHVEAGGTALVEPPGSASGDEAKRSFDRVSRWFDEQQVRVLRPAELEGSQESLIAASPGELRPRNLSLPRRSS